jgi:hypothetical protein
MFLITRYGKLPAKNAFRLNWAATRKWIRKSVNYNFIDFGEIDTWNVTKSS